MTDPKKTSRTEDEPGFSEAMGELEEILERIETEEVDIDQLATELRRAAHLLELCRNKIRKAEIEVTQIVQTLEEDTDEAPSDPDDDDDIPF